MRLVDEFTTFLEDEVNLNDTRITRLEKHVRNLENFVSVSDWGPKIRRYSAQGSWAHKTIIKPPGTKGFDADLLVFIDPVEDWTPEDYIFQLRRVFRGSGVYKEKTSLSNRCVTIEYAGDFDVDVVPCVIGRAGGASQFEVCNRVDDVFEPTDSEAYTAWLEQRNIWVGNDRLREMTRLLKYLRDIKLTFSCKSILLTTLIGERITAIDQIHKAEFEDLPTVLKTLVGRLDDYLQARPNLHDVCNPVLQDESFTRQWDDDKYRNFRDLIRKYREWIDEAYDELDEDKSRAKWREVFGDEFGKKEKKGATQVEEAALVPLPLGGGLRDAVLALQRGGQQLLQYIPKTVPWMKQAIWPVAENQTVVIRATAHRDRSGNTLIGVVQSGQIVQKAMELRFEAVTAVGVPYAGRDAEVRWQVVNTDYEALAEDGLRGGFYPSHTRAVRWESTSYRGIHWVQAYVIRRKDRKRLGRSERFFVVIE